MCGRNSHPRSCCSIWPDQARDPAACTIGEIIECTDHNEPGSGDRNSAQFLMESPLAGAELNMERQVDYGRTVEL